MNHGAKEPFFGVKVQDMKKIQKKVKKNHELSLELYATGNGDAMYLAGLIADEKKISKAELQQWVEEAYWSMISEYAVPWVASESPHGFELGLEWIESDQEHIASAGWSALASWASIRADEDLDIPAYVSLFGSCVAGYSSGSQSRTIYNERFCNCHRMLYYRADPKVNGNGSRYRKSKCRYERNSL